MSAFKGEKVGLVGPNGAGKSTIFRMIVKEEEPDGGNVAIDKGVTVGYFSQDVGEMRGRTVVAETMAGAGEVSDAAEALHSLEHAMADPERADEIEQLVEQFGHAQARFDELGGYALEARARRSSRGSGSTTRRRTCPRRAARRWGPTCRRSRAAGRCAWPLRAFS